MNDIVVDKKKLGTALQDAHEAHARIVNAEEKELVEKYGSIPGGCFYDVFYLRTRARWTEELEQELIRLWQAGTPPNVMEFGCGSGVIEKIVTETEAKYKRNE